MEDSIYRNLEPALAFQLELSRMRQFDVTQIPSANNNIHIYLGAAKQVCFSARHFSIVAVCVVIPVALLLSVCPSIDAVTPLLIDTVISFSLLIPEPPFS